MVHHGVIAGRRIDCYLRGFLGAFGFSNLFCGIHIGDQEVRIGMMVAVDSTIPIEGDGHRLRQPEFLRWLLELDLVEVNFRGDFCQPDEGQRSQEISGKAEDLVILGINPGQSLAVRRTDVHAPLEVSR